MDENYAVTDAYLAAGTLHPAHRRESLFDAVTEWQPGEPIMHLRREGRRATPSRSRALPAAIGCAQGGRRPRAIVRSRKAAELAALMPKKVAADTSKFLLCPMPGLVVSVNVQEGQDVKAGETLAVVEAMKMENVLTAERDGTVKKINAKKGDSLALDDVILEFA